MSLKKDIRMEQIKIQRDMENLLGFSEDSSNITSSYRGKGPYVGIWWVYKGKVLTEKYHQLDKDQVETINMKNKGVLFYPKKSSHQTLWNSVVVRNYPDLKDKKYDTIPRGRIEIIEKQDSNFIVRILCSEQLKMLGPSHDIVKKILSAHDCIGLPLEFITDEHYLINKEVFDTHVKFI